MRDRIYIDTSIIGGYFDIEFKENTTALFERFENDDIIFVVSDILELELINAPRKVKDLLQKYSSDKFDRINFNEESANLADKYIKHKVVGKASIVDCRHIALATVYKVDILASWNFKHIVNLDKIKGYNSINLKLGYQELEIRSPKELRTYENDK